MKRKFNHFYLSLLGGALLTLGACSKNDDPEPLPPTPEEIGIYVLNEGANMNSGLGFLSLSTTQYTDEVYPGGIGKGANDIAIYGTKLYVAVTDENKLLVLDAASRSELETINISFPRSILSYRGKIYVTSQGENKLVAVDTSNYSVNSVSVGRSPEQLTAISGKIYVANSGWREASNGGDYDDRISVVNASSLTVENSITVAENIQTIAADTTQNVLYVNAAPTYSSQPVKPSKLYVVNTANNQITPMNFGAEDIAVVPETKQAYMISRNYNNSEKATCLLMNLTNQTVQNFGNDANMENPYSIRFLLSAGGLLLIGDAKSDYTSKGKFHIYTLYQNGSSQFGGSFNAGVSPKAFAFNINEKK
ncbi:YncE family protein [Olivibacter domesticus]|uniref:40-residue YVTN family beta-propeller repeat-containing protein n=1 Tax=Olivibacter domesticus TaxID=407022 RepID=A0A1H7HYB5_OLID1|nr:hypothetical protein [Olivibacter domesticus]SEK55271.1 40-residue YVTN family beta-propeller repeat-containing protein [Olivibacter domesticus]